MPSSGLALTKRDAMTASELLDVAPLLVEHRPYPSSKSRATGADAGARVIVPELRPVPGVAANGAMSGPLRDTR